MAKARHSRFDCNPGCSVEATLTLIDGKFKCVILYHLLGETMRFNEIHRRIGSITERTLANQMRELENDGLVIRTVFDSTPPRVEYSISALGRSLETILKALRAWGDDNIDRFGKTEPSND